jgi:hypothetical protein
MTDPLPAIPKLVPQCLYRMDIIRGVQGSPWSISETQAIGTIEGSKEYRLCVPHLRPWCSETLCTHHATRLRQTLTSPLRPLYGLLRHFAIRGRVFLVSLTWELTEAYRASNERRKS